MLRRSRWWRGRGGVHLGSVFWPLGTCDIKNVLWGHRQPGEAVYLCEEGLCQHEEEGKLKNRALMRHGCNGWIKQRSVSQSVSHVSILYIFGTSLCYLWWCHICLSSLYYYKFRRETGRLEEKHFIERVRKTNVLFLRSPVAGHDYTLPSSANFVAKARPRMCQVWQIFIWNGGAKTTSGTILNFIAVQWNFF